MANALNAAIQTVTDTPVPEILLRLGLAIAEAQAALDANSVTIARQLAESEITIGNKTYNLLALGFSPTFYAFTEATIETKVCFSFTRETEFALDVGVKVKYPPAISIVAASVNVRYAQKHAFKVEGSSSIAARLVSLPPPEAFQRVIRAYVEDELGGMTPKDVVPASGSGTP